MDRYQLFISNPPGKAVAIRIYDGMLNRILLKWQGEIARRLLDADILPYAARCDGCRRCDKDLIHKLTIAAAAIAATLEADDRNEFLQRRLEKLDRRLSGFHAHVASLLFAHPERHFGHEEVVCLLSLNNPCVSRRRIFEHLDDLVRWQVIQRINVDDDHVFYDINTDPHLHIYCRRTHELVDAPRDGVVQIHSAVVYPPSDDARRPSSSSLRSPGP